MTPETKNLTYNPAIHDAAIAAGYAAVSRQIHVSYPNVPENHAIFLRIFRELSTPGKYPFSIRGCAFGMSDLGETAPAEWRADAPNSDAHILWRPGYILIQPETWRGDFYAHRAAFDAFIDAFLGLLPPVLPEENRFCGVFIELCIHVFDDVVAAEIERRAPDLHMSPAVYRGSKGRLICAGRHIGFMPSRNRTKYYVLPGWQLLLLADARKEI